MRIHALTITVTLLVASVSQATNDAACFNRDIERLDHAITPPEGGDNAFFTGISNASDNTNVTLAIDAKGTMNEFTQRIYKIRSPLLSGIPWGSLTGCNNVYMNNLPYFMPSNITAPAGATSLQGLYSPSKTYPDPGSYSGGYNFSDRLVTQVSGEAAAYRYQDWPSGPSQSGTARTFDDACSYLPDDVSRAACKSCLQSNGYYLNPWNADNDTSSAAGVFTTNWLRFHPVKWVLLTLAYKRLVNGPLLSQLRDAVVVSNGANGGILTQKMLPQDCHGQGRPQNQKASAIDTVNYTGTSDPLAEMLFNVAWYMGGQQTSWIFSNPSYSGTAVSGNKSGPCTACTGAGDFIVLFADGRGDTANPTCTKPDGTKSPYCQAQQQCGTLGMGVGDGDNYLDPTKISDVAAAITGNGVRTAYGPSCQYDFADDVAHYISQNTVSVGNPNEKIHTYVVAIGDPANTEGEMGPLIGVATGGGGQYLVADDFRTLETNIEKVFKTIISSATSFSSAAITTVQSQGYTSAYIPRFTPLPGPQWNGTLARLDFFNEFASGCSPADYGTIGDTSKSPVGTNPNKNNSCYDVYLTDKNGNFVGEQLGQFVQLDNTATWDGGWPKKTSADGGSIAAVPFWEASDVLTTRENAVLAGSALPDGGTATERKILTAKPNSDGTYSNAGMIDFSVANVSQITPLLALGGVNGQFCTTLASRTRHTYTTEDDCATDVINFVHGQDVLMQNPYNREIATDGGFVAGTPSPQHARPYILGDIFHSSPVLVTPPIPTFLCDLGVATQCVASLYDPSLEGGGKAAYAGDGGYVPTYAHRKQFILVGSNDGMIHAFNAGNYDSTTDAFDTGTGNELWAFIPPEMLPKLVRYMIGETHELLVDGTPMVRDIWVDANNDLQKDIGEFHTIAIVGDREGGRHFSALDVTDPANPVFRWSWPLAGSTWTLNEGQSWNDLGPSPPAIGPIAEAVDPSTAGAITVNGVKARERYIFATGGGFDPAYLRGRSIDFLDAWTGQEVYRYAFESASSSTDPQKSLFPVAAPVSLLDTNADGIFDTAVVGDTGGQVWTISMFKPGSDTNGDGRYDNWYGGRAFVQAPVDGSGTGSFSDRSPFFQRAVAAKLGSGQIQIYLGSGDRSQIKDPNGGTCGLANLSACMRKGCSVSAQSQVYGIGPSGGTSGTYATGTFSFGGGTSTPTFSGSYDSAPIGVACSDKDDAKVTWNITCPADAGTFEADLTCDWGATSDGGVECPVSNPRPELANVNAGTPTLAYSRFYSLRLFDASGNRAQFSDATGAGLYDGAAFTDANLVNADLTSATDTSPGWYVRHAHSSDERTSSSALLLGGCVLWNTLLPNPSSGLTCSGSIPLDTAFGYQADVSSGAIACGDPGSATYTATVRSSSRSTYVAPQPPAPVISVNRKSGQVAYGSVSLDPGSPPSASTMGTNDMVAPVQWLEVPRKVHDCRHNGTNCN